MTGTGSISRRHLVKSGASILAVGGIGLGSGRAFAQASAPAAGAHGSASIISGENTALMLQELMKRKGYMEEFGVTPIYENEADGAAIPGRLLSGRDDMSAQSGITQLLPAIENGQDFRIMAGAEALPVMAVYTGNPKIRHVKDLVGHTIGVGTPGTLLHVMMLALLRKHGVAEKQVKFVNIGGSFDVFKAVSAKKVDAGPSTADYLELTKQYHVSVLSDGEFWKELPQFTLNASYTTAKTIAAKRDTLVHTLAAYGKLYRFIQSPGSKEEFIAARTAALGKTATSDAEGLSQWQFFQRVKPFATGLVLSKEKIDFIQKLNIQVGKQKAMLPYEQVTDVTLAQDALKLIG